MKAIIFSVAILLTAYLAVPAHAAMQEDVDQAVTIIERFQEIPEKAIPTAVMRDAKGLAILTSPKLDSSSVAEAGPGLSLRESKRAGAVLRQSVREE